MGVVIIQILGVDPVTCQSKEAIIIILAQGNLHYLCSMISNNFLLIQEIYYHTVLQLIKAHTILGAFSMTYKTFFLESRWLLLSTLPVLLVSLIFLVLGNVIDLGSVAHAIISTVSVIVYFCCFVMGFGPIPNILCAEIFPTRVRGLCIAICALTFWIGDIIVTYTLPVMLNSIGLAGVFGIYAVVCTIAWFFVFIKVPETKGMPLEVITEFFAVGAKQTAGNN